MSEKHIMRCDKMMETRLKENSQKLGISIDDLIDCYIRRELFIDMGFHKRQKSFDELKEMLKRDERDGKIYFSKKSEKLD